MDSSTRNIGVHGHSGQDSFMRRIGGILRYCDEVGGLFVRDFQSLDMIEDYTRPPPWTGKVDGMIVSMGQDEISAQKLADWLVSAGVPTVNVAADWFDPRVPACIVDSASLAEVAAEHLIDCQCNSFLYAGYSVSTGSAARGSALRGALASRGRDLTEHVSTYRMNGSFADEGLLRGDEKLVKLLHEMRKPLGIWALNDNVASAICFLCESLGLAVPEMIKVLGVGDSNMARLRQLTLSSIRTPGDEVGYQAARTLHRMLEKKSGIRKVTEVPATEVVARQSTVASAQATGDLDEVLEYIKRNACDGVNVDQLVDIVGVSRRVFETWFRQKVGHSPGEEIQRVRLERAKHLVKSTELSMSQIGLMIGYTHTAAFSRFFSNGTGMSPRDFRRGAAG